TSSSSGYGAASNTRRSICDPTKPSARREARLVGISTFTTDDDLIRALTTAPRIKPTSIFLRSARRPNPGTGSTYRRGIFVQTTGTSSVDAWSEILHGALEYNEHLDPLLRGSRIDRARTFDWGQSAALVLGAYRRLSSGGLDTE